MFFSFYVRRDSELVRLNSLLPVTCVLELDVDRQHVLNRLRQGGSAGLCCGFDQDDKLKTLKKNPVINMYSFMTQKSNITDR